MAEDVWVLASSTSQGKVTQAGAGCTHWPDKGSMLGPDEHEEADTHQLLWSQQHILVISGDGLLQLSSPELLIRGAGGEIENTRLEINQTEHVSSWWLSWLNCIQEPPVSLEAVNQSQVGNGAQILPAHTGSRLPWHHCFKFSLCRCCLTFPNTTDNFKSHSYLYCAYEPRLQKKHLKIV